MGHSPEFKPRVAGWARLEASMYAQALYHDFEDCKTRIITITNKRAKPEFVTGERIARRWSAASATS